MTDPDVSGPSGQPVRREDPAEPELIEPELIEPEPEVVEDGRSEPTEPEPTEPEPEPTEPEPTEPEPTEPEPTEPEPTEPEPEPSEPAPSPDPGPTPSPEPGPAPRPPAPPAPPSPPTRPMPLPGPDPAPSPPTRHPDPTYPAPPAEPDRPFTPGPPTPGPSTPRHPDPSRRPEPLTEAELRETAAAPPPLHPPDEVATNPLQPAVRREHAHRAEHRADRRHDRTTDRQTDRQTDRTGDRPADPAPDGPSDAAETDGDAQQARAAQAARPSKAAKAAPAADGRRRLVSSLGLRATRGRLLAGFLCALLGFALVVQARQTQSEGISDLSQDELVRLLDQVTSNSERLTEASRDLEQQRDTLLSSGDRSEAAEQVARDRLNVLGILAGTIPATGTGIELDIADPDRQVGAPVLLDTIQELRDAGAEAMQVNGQRIVASSYFVDDGSSVRIGTAQLTPPYRFRVIGDPQTLGAALEIPGGVLEVLRQRGATGTVTPSQRLVVDALTSVPQPTYAEPAPGSS